MIFRGKGNEYFELQHLDAQNFRKFRPMVSGTLQLLWFQADGNQLVIDGIRYGFDNNQIISLSQYHQVEYKRITAMKMLRFNAEFYCIINHDSLVGCKGVLYYTPAKIPVVTVAESELPVMAQAWNITDMELEMKDELQLEMLQIVLKRILILCTRMYKAQGKMAFIDDSQHDLIREFNFLVEQNFKEQHQVAYYAGLLHRSPKTITNTFKKIGEASPLQIIHSRILLEAKKLLRDTRRAISEIAYDLGFENVQVFSRFFSRLVGHSPTAFRMKRL